MICDEADAAASVHGALLSAANYSGLAPDVADHCRAIAETVADPNFPGALVPAHTAAGDVRVYAISNSAANWRRLNPVLMAFAGPTLTSYTGLPSELPHGDPVSGLLRQTNPATTGILCLPTDTKGRIAALRALSRARDTLARAPSLQRSSPEPTSWLLAHFQDYLNVGRRDAATAILGRMREELRLDALNLKFLEVQLLAAFGDWSAILNLPGFASLCVARRPPAVTALLLEALYQVYLDGSFEAQYPLETKARYEESVRPFAHPMLVVPMPEALTLGALRLYALEAWVSTSRRDILIAIEEHREAIGWIFQRLPAAGVEDVAVSVLTAESPLDNARHALMEIENRDSLDSVATALALLDELSPADLTRLREAEPFRSLLRSAAEAAAPGGLPVSWPEWLAKVSDPAFTNAVDVARKGKDEWQIDDAAGDPIAVKNFVSALERAQSDSVAGDRTEQALPFIVAWLRRDPAFPRSAMVAIYENLLTLFAMSAIRRHSIYESSQILIHALLTTGLTNKAYRAVIADIEELAGEGFGVDMIYWLLEIIEELMRFGAPDADAREAFLHGAMSKIAPIYSRLSRFQRAAIAYLADALGWKLETFGLTGEGTAPDDFAAKMDGQRIAIYTLTESSGRQAKAAIKEAAPTAIVDCSADHVGTARLRALAENSDLFVLTSLSAKHAATEFIRKHRSRRPLIYAQGRGFSSILRAIEDHLRASKD